MPPANPLAGGETDVHMGTAFPHNHGRGTVGRQERAYTPQNLALPGCIELVSNDFLRQLDLSNPESVYVWAVKNGYGAKGLVPPTHAIFYIPIGSTAANANKFLTARSFFNAVILAGSGYSPFKANADLQKVFTASMIGTKALMIANGITEEWLSKHSFSTDFTDKTNNTNSGQSINGSTN